MTVLGGGKDRAWLEPLDEKGNVKSDDPNLEDMVGCHQGNFTGLNMTGVQAGTVVVWERNNPKDLLSAKMRGGEVIRQGDPEAAAAGILTDDRDTQMDSTYTFGDVVAVRYSEDAIRRIREAENTKAQNMMRSGAKDFLDRATNAERQIAGGVPTRFRRHDHRLDFVDDADRVVDQWVPGDGIID